MVKSEPRLSGGKALGNKAAAEKPKKLSEIAKAANLPEDAKLSEILAVVAKSAKPVKMSKIGEWWLKHPKGLGVTYVDWKAVMR